MTQQNPDHEKKKLHRKQLIQDLKDPPEVPELPEIPDAKPKHAKGYLIAFFAFILCTLLPIANEIFPIFQYIQAEYRQQHPQYPFESRLDWKSMEQLEVLFSEQSTVEIYGSKNSASSQIYHDAAALTFLYNNLSEHTRIINKFTVRCSNIKENYDPVLLCKPHLQDGVFSFDLSNDGWGETGDLHVSFLDIVPSNPQSGDCSVLSLKPGTPTDWEIDSIRPGEVRTEPFISLNDLEIDWGDRQTRNAYLDIRFKVESDRGLDLILTFTVLVNDDFIELVVDGLGGGSPVYYVIWIDTEQPEWSRTFEIYQPIPANECIRIPVIIVPEMSCSMSVTIEFETADGEIIHSEPLNNAVFRIPYYNHYETYVDGTLLGWTQDTDHQKVISFPFTSISSVVDPEDHPQP